jgi:hypothetical protein
VVHHHEELVHQLLGQVSVLWRQRRAQDATHRLKRVGSARRAVTVVRHTQVLEQLRNHSFGQLSNANPLAVASCVTVVALAFNRTTTMEVLVCRRTYLETVDGQAAAVGV